MWRIRLLIRGTRRRRDERGMTLIELIVAAGLTMMVLTLIGTILLTVRWVTDTTVVRTASRSEARTLLDGIIADVREAKPLARCVRYEDDDPLTPAAQRRCVEQQEIGSAVTKADGGTFCYYTYASPDAAASGRLMAPDHVCIWVYDYLDGTTPKEALYESRNSGAGTYVTEEVTDPDTFSDTGTFATPMPTLDPSAPNTRRIGAIAPGGKPFEYGIIPVDPSAAEYGGLQWTADPGLQFLDRVAALRVDLSVTLDKAVSSVADRTADDSEFLYSFRGEAFFRVKGYEGNATPDGRGANTGFDVAATTTIVPMMILDGSNRQ